MNSLYYCTVLLIRWHWIDH